MMNCLYPILSFFCLFGSCLGQNYKTLFIFSTDPGDTLRQHLESSKIYNEKKQLIEENIFNAKTKIRYTYEDTALVAMKEIIDGKDSAITSYLRNSTGLIMRETKKDKSGITYSDVYIYDKKNHLEKEYIYSKPDSSKIDYRYDKSGNLIRETRWSYIKKGRRARWKKEYVSTQKWTEAGKPDSWYYSSGNSSPKKIESWEWDSAGKLKLDLKFNSSGILQKKLSYAYGVSTFTIETTSFDANGGELQLKTDWEYYPKYFTYGQLDTAGRLVEEKIIDDRNYRVSLRRFKYNNAGDVLEEAFRNLDGRLSYNKIYEYH